MPGNVKFSITDVPVNFGGGAINDLGGDATALGLRRPLLLADAHSANTGHADRARSSLEAAGIAVEVFADVLCEPTISSWQAAVDHAAGGTFDGFIAVGGGSTIDTAKAVRLLSAYPADPRSYIEENRTALFTQAMRITAI